MMRDKYQNTGTGVPCLELGHSVIHAVPPIDPATRQAILNWCWKLVIRVDDENPMEERN